MSWHHVSSWPGTYSDNCVNQVTTAPRPARSLRQGGSRHYHGREWGDRQHLGVITTRTIVAFPGPPFPFGPSLLGIHLLGDLRRRLAESSLISLPWSSVQGY